MKLQEALLLIGPHSQAAICQVTPPASRLDAEVSSPAEALQHAFLWRESIEGYNFWAVIHKQLESGTPIPEPVAVIPEPVAMTPEPEPEPIYGLPNGAPPPPPAPDGYQWVYRGTNWASKNTIHCYLRADGRWTEVYYSGNTGGVINFHYLEAVPVPTAPEPEPVGGGEPMDVPPPTWPSNMPPLPELPTGFDRWEYRGTRWTARHAVYACWFDHENRWRFNSFPSNAGGATCHYAEAVKVVAAPEPEHTVSLIAPIPRNLLPIPRYLLPLPELPEGFSQWVYHGTGWSSGGRLVHFQCKHVVGEEWDAYYTCASGVPHLHYIEAVREPLQCEVGRCYVQRDGVIRGELAPTPETTSGGDVHPFFDGVFFRTREGRIFTYDTFGSSAYIAEVEPQ